MKNRISEKTWEEIRAAAACGIAYSAVGRHFGVPGRIIRARAREEGWTKQFKAAAEQQI